MKNNFTFYLWADAEKSIGLGHLNRIRSYPNVYWPIIDFEIFTKFNYYKTLVKKVVFLSNSIKFFVKHMKIPLEFKKGEGKKFYSLIVTT